MANAFTEKEYQAWKQGQEAEREKWLKTIVAVAHLSSRADSLDDAYCMALDDVLKLMGEQWPAQEEKDIRDRIDNGFNAR